MEIRQLEIFLAVVDTSSVTIAAGQMNLSPGAVSLQLQNLATGLHTELFVRAGKHLKPTAAAHRLAELARLLLTQARAIEHEFDAAVPPRYRSHGADPPAGPAATANPQALSQGPAEHHGRSDRRDDHRTGATPLRPRDHSSI